MNKAKKTYKGKCKKKQVTFYPNEHDTALFNYANSINFQAFVKKALIDALIADVKKWVQPKSPLFKGNIIY